MATLPSGRETGTSGVVALGVLGLAAATILWHAGKDGGQGVGSVSADPPVASATTIVTSSALQGLDAHGLLAAVPPGWHSQNPHVFPEWIALTFHSVRSVRRFSLLPQAGYPERGPRTIRVESSADGATWDLVVTIDNACEPRDRWRDFDLPRTITTTHLRLMILSNCGDEHLVTLRGLRLE